VKKYFRKKYFMKMLSIAFVFLMTFSTLPNSIAIPQPSITRPVVAIHVSEYTQSLNGSPGHPGSQTDQKGWYYDSFYYFQIIGMLEQALRSDGTAFVTVSDADIENGDLMDSGKPRYPIMFSLMSEAISDIEAQEIKQYVTAGGFVYSSGSAWTRTEAGLWRNDANNNANFALSAEMGLESLPTTTKPFGGKWSWGEVNNIRSTVDHRLVDHLPKNQDIFWPLPMNYDTDTMDLRNISSYHEAWVTRPTSQDPTTVLATIKSAYGFGYQGFPILTTKDFGKGNFIYHAEMAPLAGWGGYAPDTFEYVFIRRAIEWAFEKQNIPIVKVAAWPYPKKAAFQIRWDMDWYPGKDIRDLVNVEVANGVHGQYYTVTSLIKDNGAWLNWARARGAIISSHSDIHEGPDVQNPVDASNSILTSLDSLQAWTGERTSNWVAPKYRSIKDDSFQILVNNGVKSAGEQNFGPFPHFSLSMTTPKKYYDLLQLPTSEWVPNSATSSDARSRMELISAANIINAVDFYYDLGALINIYGHPYTMNAPLSDTYIKRAKEKQDVWFTNATEMYSWWTARDPVQIDPTYSTDGDFKEVNAFVSGAVDASTAVDLIIPYWDGENPTNIKVYKDGIETSDFEITKKGLKIKSGLAAEIKVNYEIGSPRASLEWVQTTKVDFESGTITNLDSTSSVDSLRLATLSGSGPYLWDDFDNPYSMNNWQAKSGQWTINNNVLEQNDTSSGYKNVYNGDSSWSNYSIEASTKFVSGTNGGQIAARLNPSTGARYALWIYPSNNTLKLVKFTNWTAWTQIGLTMSIPTIGNDLHKLRLELNGSNIKGYYDNVLYIDINDASYAVGAIGLETYGSEVRFDDVRVSSNGTTFVSSGSLISQAFDAGDDAADWKNISWTSSSPPGTELEFRTRTATTSEGLSSAAWSDYYAAFDSMITSPDLRWIQYEVSFTTSDPNNSSILNDVTLEFTRPVDLTAPLPPTNVNVTDPGSGDKLDINWTNPTDVDFNHIHIYRSSIPGLLGDLIYDNVNGATKTDATVLSGLTYYYTVRSVDSSGNESANDDQYPGTATGGLAPTNFALSFDPINDYVLVPYNSTLNISGAMTIEAFVFIRSFPNQHGIIASRWDGNNISWELYYDNTGRIYFYVKKPNNSGHVQVVTPSGVLTTGSWFHVAGVANPDADEASIYSGGLRRATSAYLEAGPRASTARFGINAEPDGTQVGDAIIDEVRISSSARYSGPSCQEPTSIFEPDANTVGLWHFNETSGLKAYDATPNHNDGDLKGAPQRVIGPDFVPPGAPTGVSVSDPGTGGSLDLSWNNPTDSDFNHTHIYRSNHVGTLGDLAFDNVTGNAQVDNTLINGITYYYTVKAVDSSGNESTNNEQYSGISTGGPITTNFALSFDPLDDYTMVAYNSSLNTTATLTVEAFVNVNAFTNAQGVIASRWDGSSVSWELYYDNTGKIFFYVRKPDNTNYTQVITSSGLIVPRTWAHVAATVDPANDSINVYHNGLKVGYAVFLDVGARSSAARLGINSEPDGRVIGDAIIDEVRISDSVRYSDPTYQIPTAPFTADANTVGLWHFDESSGTRAFDSSSNHNDGDLLGDPQRVDGYSF